VGGTTGASTGRDKASQMPVGHDTPYERAVACPRTLPSPVSPACPSGSLIAILVVGGFCWDDRTGPGIRSVPRDQGLFFFCRNETGWVAAVLVPPRKRARCRERLRSLPPARPRDATNEAR